MLYSPYKNTELKFIINSCVFISLVKVQKLPFLLSGTNINKNILAQNSDIQIKGYNNTRHWTVQIEHERKWCFREKN